MRRWSILLALVLVSAASLPAFAQNSPPATPPKHPSPGASAASTPAEKSAEKQSGLSKPEAENLLFRDGYTAIGAVQADPNSIWVWQADATKNGRRVRVGIDYRGRVLVISQGGSLPCTLPQAYLGVSSLGAGERLSRMRFCANR